ncbi:adenylyl-sulfate kinase [Bradyrhizobium sp. CCBAU 051011]|uniref:adenylyl-sulfate kinase n=1 Tax=Bradyrhizobium sp. CCBAU 051011 TaxID=858422 RepID=UPI00137A9472
MDRDPNGLSAVCFLLGLPRSGTTVLAHVLQQHPDIPAPPEPWLMLALEAFGRAEHRHPAGASLILAATSEFLDRIDRTIVSRAFADAAYGQYLAAVGKRMFIDKTPRYWMVLARPNERPEVTDQFAAHLIWMDNDPLVAGRNYILRIGTRTGVAGSITAIKHRIDVNTREHLAARKLSLNEIGFGNVATALPVAFDPYEVNRKTGSFIVIDRFTNRTVGAGMIAFPLRRATNIAWQPLSVGKSERAALKNQKPCIIWFTGLSGAGKSTIANIVDQKLFAMSRHTMLLDGDNVRHGLNRDLGFSEAHRVENIRRVGEVAKLMADGGLIVICSFISPYRAERDMVRNLVAKEELIEIFVDTPLEECVRRDPKGLYSKAKSGKIKNFTGIDEPYEIPMSPEFHLRTMDQTPEHLRRPS